MKLKIQRIDEALRDFLAKLPWPEGVPAPAVDVAVQIPDEADRAPGVPLEPKTMIRFVGVELAPVEAPADFSSPGASPFELVYALAALCEAWVKRHGADPGVYPTGIRAALIHALDLRTAGQWLYSVQLAGALATGQPAL